jgi:predicted ATPase/DNA-binding SARP family transcriptional activator
MLEIRLLGQFEVRLNNEIVKISSQASQSLLAYLVLNAGTRQRREKLAGLLWPDSDHTKARRQLRQALWRLRKSIGDEYFLADRVTLGFNPDANYTLDVEVLEDDTVWLLAPADLVKNISDYAGELLPGFYDEWTTLERERLRSVFELQMQLLLNRLLEGQRWADVLRCGECWIARGEIPELAYRALMIAHHGMGDASRISEVYHRCVEALQDELGVEPSSETRALYERLLTDEETLDMPPRTPRHNLHQPMTSFVGRENELAQVRDRLADPSCRLVTLIGPGGIGKTRLALKIAHEMLGGFAQGVFFVSLEQMGSADLILPAIADAVGFSFSEGEEPRIQIMSFIRSKDMLLVMDNFEHLIGGVPILVEILKTAPEVKIIITSRERLNISGEQVFEVKGLSYPDRDEISGIEEFGAIKLFTDRARSVVPDFIQTKENLSPIIRICQTLEGVPLALELASAWTRVVTCEEIANSIEENLDILKSFMQDVPKRQKSLRASFDHSWSSLSGEERSVVRKLAVFRSGFNKEAAEIVADASLSDLTSLMDKSILRRSGARRYEIHPLLWQFIVEKLIETHDDWRKVQELHCKYFTDFLHEQASHIRGPSQDEALKQVGDEIENVRTTMRWLVRQTAISDLGKVLDVLRVFYDVRGWYQEGDHSFGRVVECIDNAIRNTDGVDEDGSVVYGKALAGQAWFCHRLSAREKATSLLQRSLSVARKFDLKDIKADSLDSLAIVAQRQGEYQKAKNLFLESLTIWRDLGNKWWQAAELNCLVHVARSLGLYQEAKQHSEEALSIIRKSGNQWGIASALNARGAISRELEEYKEAEQYYQESLAISREIGFRGGIARASLGLGHTAYQLGEFEKAKKHCQKSLTIYTDQGKSVEIPSVLALLGDINVAQRKTQTAIRYFRDALEIALDIASAPEILRALIGLAHLLSDDGKGESVIQLLRFAIGHPAIKSSDQAKAEKLLKDLISEYSNNEILADTETMEGLELSEVTKNILSSIPGE